MVSKTSEDLPDPDTPVTTVSWLCGMSTEMFLRLWTRAPRIDRKSSTTIESIAGKHSAFRKLLLEWFRQVRRPLPWRATEDPYAIWISEVMLQQTRVATVLPYYERFLARFPTVEALASAPEEDVLQHWSGLGYYSRARNLQRAAVLMRDGFPSSYDGIRELPGVGDYTAAAVASIAFGMPHAAVDGNVLRVMARITNESGDIGHPVTRERLAQVAGKLLDTDTPGDFNQAVMELGATVCLPRNPQCLVCPVSQFCEARRRGVQNELPIKVRRKKQTYVERTLLVASRDDTVLFWRRSESEKRLRGFWELPEPEHLPGASEGKELGSFRHCITNNTYRFRVVEARITRVGVGFHWLKPGGIEYLFSTTSRKALRVAGLDGL